MALNLLKENGRNQKTGLTAPAVRGLDLDLLLLLTVLVLVILGLFMVYSTTFYWSYVDFGSSFHIFFKQVRSVFIGLLAMLFFWRADHRMMRDRLFATAIMIVTIISLVIVLAISDNLVFNAKRSFFNGSIQPGEAAKLAVIIYFSAWLASRKRQLATIGYGLIPFSLLVGLVGGLIVIQPDLSTAAIIALVAWTMFFVAGSNLLQISLAGAGAVAVGWLLITQVGYARDRLTEHINSMVDLTQADYHVQQAIIAFTAPGSRTNASISPNWFGIGLGQSRQKFGFLPAAHTDSIFAIIGEELGLVGCLLVIIAFGILVWRAFTIARQATARGDDFGAILAVGIGSWIFYEALLNIAVQTAIIPFTGIALPFISYGGSNLVVVMAGVGMLLSISRRELPAEPPSLSEWVAGVQTWLRFRSRDNTEHARQRRRGGK